MWILVRVPVPRGIGRGGGERQAHTHSPLVHCEVNVIAEAEQSPSPLYDREPC